MRDGVDILESARDDMAANYAIVEFPNGHDHRQLFPTRRTSNVFKVDWNTPERPFFKNGYDSCGNIAARASALVQT